MDEPFVEMKSRNRLKFGERLDQNNISLFGICRWLTVYNGHRDDTVLSLVNIYTYWTIHTSKAGGNGENNDV